MLGKRSGSQFHSHSQVWWRELRSGFCEGKSNSVTLKWKKNVSPSGFCVLLCLVIIKWCNLEYLLTKVIFAPAIHASLCAVLQKLSVFHSKRRKKQQWSKETNIKSLTFFVPLFWQSYKFPFVVHFHFLLAIFYQQKAKCSVKMIW